MANGYFQLVHKADSTYIKILAPVRGGMPVGVNEVMEYLGKNNISYDLSLLNAGIKQAEASGKEQTLVLLNEQECRKIRESYVLMVSADRMSGIVRFYPPSEGGERISLDEFMKDLAYQKIKFGIKKDVVEKMIAKPPYCTDVVIAEGVKPRHGTDARIEYYFDTDLRAKPTILEDHTVDFRNLNIINHCKEGDILARLIPEDKGENGADIFDTPIKPRSVERAVLKYGNNITLSPDGLTLIAGIDGHVSLVEDRVFLTNIMVFENIDNSTGNIDFEGSVQINGNVSVNFVVKAKGNIEVRGVVEGAYLEAGGDIIIARGMNGMRKGKLKAGKNIVSKFIENAEVVAEGYISAGAILHSDVVAGTEITVDGKRGFITGGRVCAANKIEVKTLGSTMGANTIVEVGMDPEVKQQIAQLQMRIAELMRIIKNNQPILNTMAQKISDGIKMKPEQMKYIQKLARENQKHVDEKEQCLKELNQLQESTAQKGTAQIVVRGEVYAGTKVCICDITTVVRSTMKYCKFIIEQGNVKMVGL